MATHPFSFITEEEYLRLDEEAERRSEYFNGKTFVVEAATEKHATLNVNLSVAVTNRLRAQKSPFLAYSQCLRVFLPATKEYAYPDLVMACGERLFAPYDTLTNPILVAEILSPTTKAFDLGTKFELYRSIPSLREYWTIAQDRVDVQQWTIRDGHWTLIEHTTAQSTLVHPQFELALDEIYFGIAFEG